MFRNTLAQTSGDGGNSGNK